MVLIEEQLLMMSERLVIDVDETGRVSVSFGQPGPTGSVAAGQVPETHLWNAEDLRWYFEDYLDAPFGLYEERASRVAELLPLWGQSLFEAVFSSADGHEALAEARRLRGASGTAELVVRSASPVWLRQPWELMRDPRAESALVLDGMSVSRCLPSAGMDEPIEVSGEALRVLMVIARPRGGTDVDYTAVARPVVEAVSAAGGRIDFEVLRPATLEALERRVQEAKDSGAPFHLLHFDGHGALEDAAQGSGQGSGQGVLIFETSQNGASASAQSVTPEQLAAVMVTGSVPLAVLNACQSGAIGKQTETAVATGLLAGGVSAVVAMGYRVYVAGAVEFMTGFYERLSAEGSLSAAVSAGRERMFRNADRPSPRGGLPLLDWAVPVHYWQRDVRFSWTKTPSDPDPRSAAGSGVPGIDPLAATGDFVGRSAEIGRLETAVRPKAVVLLHGPAGGGKSELAKAFGRWRRATAGPGHAKDVVWFSWRSTLGNADLDVVLSALIQQIKGSQQQAVGLQEIRAEARQLLRERRLLLIWDNFESVTSASQEVKDFLREVAVDSQSTVLITSRTTEDWLGTDVVRVEVAGLRHQDAAAYAGLLLADRPETAASRWSTDDVEQLLRACGGHPLTLRLMVPHLQSATANDLISRLRRPVGSQAGHQSDEISGLTASLDYALERLEAGVAGPLRALSLFQDVADSDVLDALSAQPGMPARLALSPGTPGWAEVLERAGDLGLLASRSRTCWSMHPALPAWLAGRWSAAAGADYEAERAQAEKALQHAYATLCSDESSLVRHANGGVVFAERHEGMLTGLLRRACIEKDWRDALNVLVFLNDYWTRTGKHAISTRWAEWVRSTVGGPDGEPPAVGAVHIDAEGLWSLATLACANAWTRAQRLDDAEAALKNILDVANRYQGISGVDDSLTAIRALTHQKSGVIAERRHKWSDAEHHHRSASDLYRRVGDDSGQADSLRGLGHVCFEQGRWPEATEYYDQSLALSKKIGDLERQALCFDVLGKIAAERGELDRSARYFLQSLGISEERRDLDGQARSRHSLGILASRRGDWDAARKYFQWALRTQTADYVPGMIATYNQLGRVERAQGRHSEADEWFRQSLAAAESIGDRVAVCKNLLELSRSAMMRNQFDEASKHLDRALVEARAAGRSRDIADVHLQLGAIAYSQWRFADAEASIAEGALLHTRAESWYGVAGSLRFLVVVATAQGHKRDALTWAVRCAHLARSHPSIDFGGIAPEEALIELSPLVAPERLAALWQEVTGDPMPADLLSTITDITTGTTLTTVSTQGERMSNPSGELTMNSKFAARAAAQRLAPELDRRIPQQVDALIESRSATGEQEVQFGVDAVAVASLIVSAAQLAWSVLSDLRRHRADVTRDELADQVRQGTPEAGVSDQVRDRVIAIVVEEILNDEI
ncbi:tetratricopeptide (TPR) repeat protein [Catenulispora sp. GAS73]|uniref:tetratricopeptide repeat protein n=1 Tax=Catenulispora sp. GAS73 TaxID=3156269 RepID=UPI00351479A4